MIPIPITFRRRNLSGRKVEITDNPGVRNRTYRHAHSYSLHQVYENTNRRHIIIINILIIYNLYYSRRHIIIRLSANV